MRQSTPIRLFLIVATATALAACAGDQSARSAGEYSDDASVNTNVQAAVVSVPGIHANNIHVTTYDGVVTLRGTAKSEQSAQNAVQAARQVPGVKKVDYNIQVE